jgi:hypothetical protein
MGFGDGIFERKFIPKGPVIIYGGGVAPKRNVFRVKNFADPTIKKIKI